MNGKTAYSLDLHHGAHIRGLTQSRNLQQLGEVVNKQDVMNLGEGIQEGTDDTEPCFLTTEIAVFLFASHLHNLGAPVGGGRYWK